MSDPYGDPPAANDIPIPGPGLGDLLTKPEGEPPRTTGEMGAEMRLISTFCFPLSFFLSFLLRRRKIPSPPEGLELGLALGYMVDEGPAWPGKGGIWARLTAELFPGTGMGRAGGAGRGEGERAICLTGDCGAIVGPR